MAPDARRPAMNQLLARACAACVVALPRAAIDSVRLGNQETSGMVFATIPFVIIIYLLITLRGPLTS